MKQKTLEQGRRETFKRSKELAEEICRRIVEGETVTTICQDKKMPSKQSVYNWLNDDPEFRRRYNESRMLFYEHMADEILDISDDDSGDFKKVKRRDGTEEFVPDWELVNRSRLKVDTRKWILARVLRKKYGDQDEDQQRQLTQD